MPTAAGVMKAFTNPGAADKSQSLAYRPCPKAVHGQPAVDPSGNPRSLGNVAVGPLHIIVRVTACLSLVRDVALLQPGGSARLRSVL